jgi:hypothetical protein
MVRTGPALTHLETAACAVYTLRSNVLSDWQRCALQEGTPCLTGPALTRPELLPVLSSKIDGCHRDILPNQQRSDPFIGAHGAAAVQRVAGQGRRCQGTGLQQACCLITSDRFDWLAVNYTARFARSSV